MKLQLGFMHKRDLARWFGLSTEYFMKNSKVFHHYCEELNTYASFEIVRGGIDIKEVYVDSYLSKLNLDLKEECRKILNDKAKASRLVNGGLVGSAPMIAREILRTLPIEKQMYYKEEKNFQSFAQLIRRVLGKLYGSQPMERYWLYYEDPERFKAMCGEDGFKVSAPCIQPYNCSSLADMRELTPQEMAELEKLIAEEEEHDEEHSTLQAYQIMIDVIEGVYDGQGEALKQEMKRQAKPFYRAMKRFNQKYGMVYVNRGTIYVRIKREG